MPPLLNAQFLADASRRSRGGAPLFSRRKAMDGADY